MLDWPFVAGAGWDDRELDDVPDEPAYEGRDAVSMGTVPCKSGRVVMSTGTGMVG